MQLDIGKSALVKRIVVKIGTNVLTDDQSHLDEAMITQIVAQIAAIKQQGIEVIVVSSGAVGAGRSMVKISDQVSRVVRRQVLASVGQIKLMNTFLVNFAKHDLFCSQVLATKEDFRDRQHYLNMQQCLLALLRDNIVPIINENDVVSIAELMFTDNDELAGLVAAMCNADALFILSNVDGVFDGPPSEPSSKLLKKILPNDRLAIRDLGKTKSAFGRGGMQTKLRMVQKTAQLGVDCFIINGKEPNILRKALSPKPEERPGTFIPASNKLSNIKKWIAIQDEKDRPAVIINAGAAHRICNEGASSLLPVGIIEVIGNFAKGDIVEVRNESGEKIALGLSQYGSDTAKQHAGQRGKKALIHYDYLYIG